MEDFPVPVGIMMDVAAYIGFMVWSWLLSDIEQNYI